jgi:MEDS: MEthanogen/methylotroph, DcmR Sensory domain/Putative zinc-finger
MVTELKCEEVWREISNYIDGEIAPDLRRRTEVHFRVCRNCSAILDGTRNVVQLSGDGKLFDVPQGFGQRLFSKVNAHLQASALVAVQEPTDMLLGITNDRVALGSHLIYFWETEDEFASGVRFLQLGLSNREHCVLFGHDEANDRVLGLLRAGHDVDGAIKSGEVAVLRRESSAPVTLGKIEAAFVTAVQNGARVIRYLGNLGMGDAPLPGKGVDEVLQLEAGATALGHRYPCVIVCMYDVNTVSGRLILNGGFGTHPLTVCQGALRENPYYSAGKEFAHPHRSIQ